MNSPTAITESAPTVSTDNGSGRRRSSADSPGSSIGGVRTMPSVLCGPLESASRSAAEPCEAVPDARHGENVTRLGRIGLDLASEVAHVDIDDPGLDRVFV